MKRLTNTLLYALFCAFSGAVIALIVRATLWLMQLGIDFVWDYVPNTLNFPLYTLLVCTAGGLIVGLFQKLVGPYPEELETVLGKLKKNKAYPYHNVLQICGAALLPLIFGASVGPEAGLTGVIVGLCCWAGDHMSMLKEKIPQLMQIGFSAALGAVFGAPLFGLAMPIEEKTDSPKSTVLPKATKIISVVIAILAGAGVLWLWKIFIGGSTGLPHISIGEITNTERLWGLPVALAGMAAGYLYHAFDRLTKRFFAVFQKMCGSVLCAVLGGLVLGVLGTFFPLTMFSGEHQIEELGETYAAYAPWLLILTGVLKLFLTNVCIKSGLRGGHFFPVIFSGISIGYGVALLTGLNPAFCLAVVTAALMGVMMRKPVAASLLLLLCFDIRIALWLLIAAYLGSVVPLKKPKKAHDSQI